MATDDGRGLDDSMEADFEPLQVESASDGPAEGAPLYRADSQRVLQLLSSHQFEDPWLAFRELYANALDACRRQPDGRIDVQVHPQSCVIEDRGAGFDAEAIEALTTLGRSTRRMEDAVGRFGIGFVSVFAPELGVREVEVLASRSDADGGVRFSFVPGVGGGVRLDVENVPRPRRRGTRIEVRFDPNRAPTDRVTRIRRVLSEHAGYAGVETYLDGQRLGRDLDDFVSDQLRASKRSSAERQIVTCSTVRGPLGVAAVDPTRRESSFHVVQRGLFVCDVAIPRSVGKPWIRGVYGAAYADGLELVASRNGFVRDARFERFMRELRRLHSEACYRLVQYYESSRDAYARVILVDAIRRGLKAATPETLLAEADDLFSSAVVRAPLFVAWGERELHSFEALVDASRRGTFVAQSFRPVGSEPGPVYRAHDSIERDIFRRLSGMKDMPAAARAETVARPGWWSRLWDRLLSGPRAEYSLFQNHVGREHVASDVLELLDATERFVAEPEVAQAVERLLPGALPRLGLGRSRNVFGPVAAYRSGEIRFNVEHRVIRKLAGTGTPDLAVRALLPVLAHELAHVCHELHDLNFYRTSRLLLRALASAAASVDARVSLDPTSSLLRTPDPEPSWY